MQPTRHFSTALLPISLAFSTLLYPLCTTVWGQQSASPPSALPVTSNANEQPSEKIAALDKAISKAVAEWNVPGLSVAIVKDGQVLLAKGYGVRELGKADTVDADTLFAIASNSKAFTSAAIAILVDRGQVSWDDPVSKYLPWFKLKDPLATAELKIRDLLCHRSGLGTFSGDLLWWGTNYSTREVLERSVELEPATSFRSAYGYSNLMFLAAGEVIEEVSEQDWAAFVRSEILAPIGMNRTICSTQQLMERGNFASPHKTFSDHSSVLPWNNWDNMVAAGGIISSANDMSQWLRLQLNRGQASETQQIFSAAQSHEMWQQHTPIEVSEASQKRFPTTHFKAYGLGWSLSDYLGRKVVGHGGGYDGMYSKVTLIPEENLGIVVLTNSMTSITNAITYETLDMLLGSESRDWLSEDLVLFVDGRKNFEKRITESIQPVAENTRPSRPLEEFTGSFQCPLYGNAVVELNPQQQLVLKLLPNRQLVATLEHLHFDTFIVRWQNELAWFAEGTVTFDSNAKGIVDAMHFDIPNDDMWFYELNFRRAE